MIPIDCLSCLDGLLWLRTQEQVARKMHLAQSSVSRNAKRCCEVFGVRLVKIGQEYHLDGDLTLLHMERDVHQYYEWNAPVALRIDGQLDVHSVLREQNEDEWVAGNFDYAEMEQPLKLLRRGIVDVWITQSERIPAEHDHELASVALLPGERGEQLLVRRRYVDHPRFLILREELSARLALAGNPAPQGLFSAATSRTIGTDQRPRHGAPDRLSG
ncbi:hypothetical protein NZK27_13345 [Synechococcus sp. FGCU-3]|nr:hypothetical protein [Synechococcus sp. FGCU3]